MHFSRRVLAISWVTAPLLGIGGLTASAVSASIGNPTYSTYLAGYQVQGQDFQTVQGTFFTPPGGAAASYPLLYLTDLTHGYAASCYETYNTNADELLVECYDENAKVEEGGLTVPGISPGDLIAVSLHCTASGRFTWKVTDLTTGAASSSKTVTKAPGDPDPTWNDVDFGVGVSTTGAPPIATTVLGTFVAASLTPVGGKSAALAKGSWIAQPVIATSDGESDGQVYASPTAIAKNQDFEVLAP